MLRLHTVEALVLVTLAVVMGALSLELAGVVQWAGVACNGSLQPGCPVPVPAACAEDDPCWRWSDMGNGERGVVTVQGAHVTVTGSTFCRTDIDWSRTEPLNGDPVC